MSTAVAILIAAPLYAVTTLVLAIGAWWWSKALFAVFQASHAQVQASAARAADDAIAEIEERRPPRAPYSPPTREEIVASLLAEREAGRAPSRDDQDFTTLGNEHIPESPPIMSGGMYATVNELDGG